MYCIDYLAGAKYPEIVEREHPDGFGAGFFLKLFGKAIPLGKRLIRTLRCPRERFHIVWDDNHKYIPARDDPIIIKGIRELNELKGEFSNIDIQASPFCEHNIERDPLRRLMEKIEKVNHGLTIVNCPLNGAILPGYITEIHGKLKRPPGLYQFSYDGLAQVDSDIEAFKAFHQNALSFFLWEPRLNLRWETNDTTPRHQRTDPRRKPDSKLLDSMIIQAKAKGVTGLPPRYIYKSHSENKGPDKNNHLDPRAEKPVIISPIQTSKIELIASNGQVIETFSYHSRYTDGRHRYYSDEWGFELQGKAMRIQGGNPIVRVREKDKIIGTINPGYRENEYRNKSKE